MQELPAAIGRYQIVGLLATGGMAEIFLARVLGPSGFERPVVLKRVLPHLVRDERFVNMFLDEARIVANIRHPNVVHVHELGQEEGELYLVMEYLEGESTEALLRRLRTRDRRLPHALAAHIVAEACAGLHAAHELKDEHNELVNLVHRDVSPHNILITYSGQVKVIDFGIARTAERLSHTDAGHIKGKFAYMSPEQALAEPLDRRSDVFSVGIVLFELLVGRRLFKRANDLLTFKAICQERIPRAAELEPSVPPQLDAIVAKALERDPAQRFASAAAMRRALSLAVRELPLDDSPPEMLSALMRALFAERVEQKEDLVRRVRSGSTVGALPAVETDRHVNLPELGSATPSGAGAGRAGSGEAVGSGSFQTPPPVADPASVEPPAAPLARAPRARRRRTGWWLGAAALGILVGGAGAGIRHLRATGAAPTTEPTAAAPASATPPESSPSSAPEGREAGAGDSTSRPDRPERVTVTILTSPPGARVTLGGADRGLTPAELEVAKGSAPLRLVVSRAGYQALVEDIVPSSDLRLQLVLRAEGSPAAGTASPRPTASRGFRRFD